MDKNEITMATPDQAGCWIDGHWGQYGVARMVELAVAHGFDDGELHDIAARHLASMSPSDVPGLTDDEWQTMADSVDHVEDWMTGNVAPDGFSFGWHDGEFFLQSDEWWQDGAY
jgi:hypothetical protein